MERGRPSGPEGGQAAGLTRSRRRAGISTWISRTLMAAALVLCLWLFADFNRFAHEVTRAPLGDPAQAADAGVVLTGRSDARLRAGLALLEQGRVPRLLISGVFANATDEEVRAVIGGRPELYACCVTLGREAQSTVGNAREIAEWVARSPTRSLLLVTEAWHMPRALLEVRRALPGLEVSPYAIRQPPYVLDDPWSNSRVIRALALEYAKLLVVRARLELKLPGVLGNAVSDVADPGARAGAAIPVSRPDSTAAADGAPAPTTAAPGRSGETPG
jgi:uncharacterized SAM-binding protein YcdF (DUF218 family)